MVFSKIFDVARSKVFTENKNKKMHFMVLSKIRKRLYDHGKCKLTPAVYCNTHVRQHAFLYRPTRSKYSF